jgi:Raf kinase inhibitor-like YbhB/YbcL family protein
MKLTSSAFQDNSTLPTDYTCKGRGVSPSLQISDVPEGAQSLVLVMHDPDAVGGQDFLHWAVWNLSPGMSMIVEGALPDGARLGANDGQKTSYTPACPPAGTGLHHYTFDLYALDTPLLLPEGTDHKTLEDTIRGHVITTARLVGTVQAG